MTPTCQGSQFSSTSTTAHLCVSSTTPIENHLAGSIRTFLSKTNSTGLPPWLHGFSLWYVRWNLPFHLKLAEGLPHQGRFCTGMCSRVRARLLAQHVSHPSTCTNPAASRLGHPTGRSPLCLCAILRYWTQKASGSDVARGLQLWLSEGFTRSGLSQTYPSVALDISETSLSSTLLLSFLAGPWLLLALVRRVALPYSLLVTSHSPPTCDGAGLGRSCFSNIVCFSKVPIPTFQYLG